MLFLLYARYYLYSEISHVVTEYKFVYEIDLMHQQHD